ncbi:MAG TPA: hypothetical protein VGP82_18480, partial [Ktedonobacterales bacterium]|nr:hypothetical protein [Ktedonobacterales bacterium]
SVLTQCSSVMTHLPRGDGCRCSRVAAGMVMDWGTAGDDPAALYGLALASLPPLPTSRPSRLGEELGG